MRAAAIAVAAIVVTGTAVADLSPGVLAPSPAVAVMHPAGSAGSSAQISVANLGGTDQTITELDADGTCDEGVTGSAALPLAIAAGSSEPVTVACAPGSGFAIRRCELHARGSDHADLADLTAVCATTGAFALAIAPAGGVSIGSAPIGVETTATVTLTNTGSAAAALETFDLADASGELEIASPCDVDSAHCTTDTALAPGSAMELDLRCTPLALGSATTNLFVVTDNGGALGPYPVTCNGITGTTGPSIAFDRGAIAVGAIAVGSASPIAVVRAGNAGDADLHIATIAITGGASTDWTASASGACSTTPCTLAAGSSVELDLGFAPTALTDRDSTLVIVSDDPSHPTSVVTLAGTGIGATLAADPSAGSPIAAGSGTLELGSVATGGSASVAIALRNDGNAPLAPLALAIAQDTAVFAVQPTTLTIGPSSQATVTVTCAPTDRAAFTGTLTITAEAALTGSPLAIPLACDGTTGNAIATASPLLLGEIRAGAEPLNATVELSTTGATVEVTSPPSLDSPNAALAVGALGSDQISSAAPTTFTISVDPSALGSAAVLSLADHLAITAGNQTLDVPVSGAIVTPAVAPTATRDLGSFCVGEPTTSVALALTSTGTATVMLTAPPTMAAGASSPFEVRTEAPTAFPFPLAPGARAIAAVTPKRARIAGAVADELTWSDDIADAPTQTTLVEATFTEDGGAISPGAIDFGSSPIHLENAAPQTVTIQNCGAEAITLSPAALTHDDPFHVVGTLPSSLLPAQTATLLVEFAPTKVEHFTDELTVHATKGMDMFDLVVDLSGDGVLTVTPDAGPAPTPAQPAGCSCGAAGDPRSAAGSLVIALATCVVAATRRRGSSVARRRTSRSPRASCRSAARCESPPAGDGRRRTCGD